MTVNNLIVKLVYWNFGKCWVPFHCHHSQWEQWTIEKSGGRGSGRSVLAVRHDDDDDDDDESFHLRNWNTGQEFFNIWKYQKVFFKCIKLRSLTTKCSLASYSEHPMWEFLLLFRGYNQCIRSHTSWFTSPEGYIYIKKCTPCSSKFFLNINVNIYSVSLWTK